LFYEGGKISGGSFANHRNSTSSNKTLAAFKKLAAGASTLVPTGNSTNGGTTGSTTSTGTSGASGSAAAGSGAMGFSAPSTVGLLAVVAAALMV
jgi:hypothetical protein